MANGNLQAMLELVVEIMSSFVKIMILPIFTEKWNGNLLNKNFEWINVLSLKYDWLQMWINEMQWNEIVWTFFYIYGWYFGLSRNFTTTNTNDNNHNANNLGLFNKSYMQCKNYLITPVTWSHRSLSYGNRSQWKLIRVHLSFCLSLVILLCNCIAIIFFILYIFGRPA